MVVAYKTEAVISVFFLPVYVQYIAAKWQMDDAEWEAHVCAEYIFLPNHIRDAKTR